MRSPAAQHSSMRALFSMKIAMWSRRLQPDGPEQVGQAVGPRPRTPRTSRPRRCVAMMKAGWSGRSFACSPGYMGAEPNQRRRSTTAGGGDQLHLEAVTVLEVGHLGATGDRVAVDGHAATTRGRPPRPRTRRATSAERQDEGDVVQPGPEPAVEHARHHVGRLLQHEREADSCRGTAGDGRTARPARSRGWSSNHATTRPHVRDRGPTA